MGITLGFGANNTVRENKGKSYIDFPSDYCVVDTETTGLSPVWDNLIEIGVIKYSNGVAIEEFQSLVQPPAYDDGAFVDDFIAELTGITNEMLAVAPQTRSVIKDFAEFLGDNIIVGYNVCFDVNFLYDNFVKHLNRPMTNGHIDVLRMARKLYPDLAHHRLKDMVDYFGLTNQQAHRSLSDCMVTELCFEKLREEALLQYGSKESFIRAFMHTGGGRSVRAAEIIGDESKVNTDSPLYNQCCVFTGKLERYTRKEALQIVADLGGINEDRITKNTNFLILGNNDYCKTIKDGKSSKQKKAEQYKLSGQDIEIVSETVFYDMLYDEA